MKTDINYDFKPTSYKQQMKDCLLKRTQSKDGKWNLERKEDGTFISEIWFDTLGTWSSYSSSIGDEHEVFGWDGLIFLETPIKTLDSVYPYSVKSIIYHYSSDGELLSIGENTCGIWSYDVADTLKYNL